MTERIRPPSYAAVIASPPSYLDVRSERQTNRRVATRAGSGAHGSETTVRTHLPQMGSPACSALQSDASEDILPPPYSFNMIAGVDRAVLDRGAALGHGHLQTAPISAYNEVLSQTASEMNATMGPLQRRLARAIAITGSLVAMGGAVAAGVLGATMLGSVASGVGIPIGAVAAIAAVAVFVAGSVLTLLLGVASRALLRAPLLEHPALGLKIDVLREMRMDLTSKKRRSKAEQELLRSINKVLSKVDGLGMHFKVQTRLMAKTQVLGLGGVFFAGAYALAAAMTGDEQFTPIERKVASAFRIKSRPFRDRPEATVSLPDARERLQLLSKVIAVR